MGRDRMGREISGIKTFVLDAGVQWKPVEGCQERHHMGLNRETAR